ncbi:uncharacterized protein LOC134829124 [Culicoides brevitarsis]|uniref:uncharacterized protein LOC134829124 n=1 Tax=Culicoides brevitarsis TaxID=469753 RepID=UPI00307BF510
MSVQILTYGARLHQICVPDRHGRVSNVILNCENVSDYVENTEKATFLNATVGGRSIGVIKNAKFCLDGENYFLKQNLEGKNYSSNTLDNQIWKPYVTSCGDIIMSTISKDGEDGFPGALFIQARFSLKKTNELSICYSAHATEATPCDISSRIFFNLAGNSTFNDQKTTLYDHILSINASQFTFNLPDGTSYKKLMEISGTEHDLRIPQQLGIAISRHPDKGFDCFYKILSQNDNENDKNELKFVSKVVEPRSGRILEIYTTQNYVRFNTCNDFHELTPIFPDYDLEFLGLTEFPKRELKFKTKKIEEISVKSASNPSIEVSETTSEQKSTKSLTKSSEEGPNEASEDPKITPTVSDEAQKSQNLSSKHSEGSKMKPNESQESKNSIKMDSKHSELTIHDSKQSIIDYEVCEDELLMKIEEKNDTKPLSEKFLKHSAFYIQPQNFPNAVNHQKLYGDIILRPGKTYKNEILLKFGVHTGTVITKPGKPNPPKPEETPKNCCHPTCPRRHLSRCCDYCDKNCKCE